MCGRFALTLPPQAVASWFGAGNRPNFEAHYNIAPSQDIAVIRPAEDGGRELAFLEWGLIPHWAKEEPSGGGPINARAETVLEKPFFRTAIRKGRCLVPADSYYEWMPTDGHKQPFRIKRSDDNLFAFAGLSDCWTSEEGRERRTVAILTMAAEGFVREIHSRMPVIVRPDFFKEWLENDDAEAAMNRLETEPVDEFEAIAVSRYVNNTRNDDQKCFKPVPDQQRLL